MRNRGQVLTMRFILHNITSCLVLYVLNIEYPGAFYHVTSRGSAREAIYWDDDDRTAFLTVLCEVIVQHRWQCHAYCLIVKT